MKARSGLWLCLPPLLLGSGDIAATLIGQPQTYWNGDYDTSLEFNPIGKYFLNIHPLAFAVGAVILIVTYCLLISTLPIRYALMISWITSFLHAIGGAGWIWRIGDWFIIPAVVYLIAADQLLRFCWYRARK